MVNFKICRKCSDGTYHQEETGLDGKILVFPSVLCHKTEDLLLMNSEVPDVCPYLLEHQMSCQDIPESMANKLSGDLSTGDGL